MNMNTLGLCRKAGRLIYGFDAVLDELAKPNNKGAGILLASDLSPKTRKELVFRLTALGSSIPVIDTEQDMERISRILGKRSGIILITDEGLFRSLCK